ncbi:hypothetical protein [Wenxinia marina]|uniref:Uncharacterized protein n=1 Tax=Wenxinia marina DSM 24838 TaxID=1123501 RepID=A0A0D0QA95_9RHOB|nr:hypothetical protein [Wenxinia marina]KIQ71394.1 hypothetical protein Wenmar_04105 [Wenxinia marina DSM 24838]GGL79181.1 hypothetical protein GCM10011392_37100 [Wenxinia marina]
MRSTLLALALSVALPTLAPAQGACRNLDSCITDATDALRAVLDVLPGQASRLDRLEARVRQLESDLDRERAAIRYTFTDGSPCPTGWVSLGTVGWLWEIDRRGTNLSRGGDFNDRWEWSHPRICERSGR